MLNINNNQQPSQPQLQSSQPDPNFQQQPSTTIAQGAALSRQHLLLGEAKQHSQASSNGNGRTHRAILSQGHEVSAQMQFGSALLDGSSNATGVAAGVKRGWEGSGSKKKEEAFLNGSLSGQAADLSRSNLSGVAVSAGQSSYQVGMRKGHSLLNSSRPNNNNNTQHSTTLLDQKSAATAGASQQQNPSMNIQQQQIEFLSQGVAKVGQNSLSQPAVNQNWMQTPAEKMQTQRTVGFDIESETQKSQSQQVPQRDSNMQQRDPHGTDGQTNENQIPQSQQNSGINQQMAIGALHQQNAQLIRSLGRGQNILGLGSVNSNSTATMTVATALSVHNSSDRQASLPMQKQLGTQGGLTGGGIGPLTVLPANILNPQQNGQAPLKKPFQHIMHPPPASQISRDQQHTNSDMATPLKIGQIPQSSGRMKEHSAAGSSIIGSEALSRISGQASKTTNCIKESRSPQMVLNTLLNGQNGESQQLHQNLNSDTQMAQGGNALPNLGVITSQSLGLQHKTPQIQLPSLLQNGAAANMNNQAQTNMSGSKVKSFQRIGASYTYSHMKSPSASQADHETFGDRRNVQTGGLFQLRNKTTHSSINSGRKQIFSKSYATKEQIGHTSGSGGFANMTRSIEIHEVANSVERDRRESAESVEGGFFPEAIEGEIKGRYDQNSRERRLRSLGGKPLSTENYEITTQSQNERINRLMQKKTSLPLENNINSNQNNNNNILSTANSEQLPTLSPNRQTTNTINTQQVSGSAHLNNILSTLKKPGMTNGIANDNDNGSKSVSPNYPLKQSMQQQHKVIPLYSNSNNGLSQTPISNGLQNHGSDSQQKSGTMIQSQHHISNQQPATFKPNAIKLTQPRPPQVPGTSSQHLPYPSVAQQHHGNSSLVQQQHVNSQPLSETNKTQKSTTISSRQEEPTSNALNNNNNGQSALAPPPAANKSFDFHFVKILLRQSSSSQQKKGASSSKTAGGDGHGEGKQETFKEILLEREWLRKNSKAIPHFSDVISKVKETEGVEITMNCNSDAFYWLIDIVKIQTNYTYEFKKTDENGEPYEEMSPIEIQFRVQSKFFEITPENCLNKLVTSHFLQINWIYEQIWEQFFLENFPAVINSCKISLNNLNQEIVAHIADRVSDAQLEKLKDRRDKFLSNLYRARIEQKLLRYCSSKRAHQITDHSIFYCEECKKIMTLKQSRRISCKFQGNEERAFVDANGNLFVAHKFCDLNLQTDNYRINQSQQTNSSQQQQTNTPANAHTPIDMAQFIRFFREQYRLCWKEIYLKFASISKNYEPEFCSQCCKWFRFCDLAGCDVRPPPNPEGPKPATYTPLSFHQVDHRNSLNCLSSEDILNFKRQIQVINDMYQQKDVESLMKSIKEQKGTEMGAITYIKFVEPQSMNFEKKLSEAYLDFKATMEKKAKQKADKETKPPSKVVHSDMPIVEDEFEDLLFQGAQAQNNIMWQLKGEPEMLKRFQKDAKAYVRDHPQAQNAQIVFDKVGSLELDGYSGSYDKPESAQSKRKLSPRSIMRVNKLVKKRIMQLKKDQVENDDGKSMQLLMQTLKAQRGNENGHDNSKKDKAKKDKTMMLSGLLEENINIDVLGRGKEQNIDIKVIKSNQLAIQNVLGAQQKKTNKVLSDISQITQISKKRNKKFNQNSSSGLCQQSAVTQSQGSKPPANPTYSSSKGDKDNNQISNTKDKEHSNRGSGVGNGPSSSHVPQSSQRDSNNLGIGALVSGSNGGKPGSHHNRGGGAVDHHQGGDTIPHVQTTQSSQRHHIQLNGGMRGVDSHYQGQQHPLHGGNYHLHVWDARDKFKNLPQQHHPTTHNIQSYHQQNMRSNSHNPSQLKVAQYNHNITTTAATAAANAARSNSICSNEKGGPGQFGGSVVYPQQFQFQHLQHKKDSSHNVHHHFQHNVNSVTGTSTQAHHNNTRQKTSQASHKNIRGGAGHHNPSSYSVAADQ